MSGGREGSGKEEEKKGSDRFEERWRDQEGDEGPE